MVMIMIGAAIGAVVCAAAILGGFKVQTKESWEEEEASTNGLRTCFYMMVAQNAKLRVALAAGEMTDDAKKVAAMTMAALSTLISVEGQSTLEGTPSLVTSVEPASVDQNSKAITDSELSQENDRDMER